MKAWEKESEKITIWKERKTENYRRNKSVNEYDW